MILGIDWIAFGFSFIGCIFTVQGKPELIKYGFIFWVIGGVLWIIYTYSAGLWSLVAVNVLFTIVEVFGVYKWYKYKPSSDLRKMTLDALHRGPTDDDLE